MSSGKDELIYSTVTMMGMPVRAVTTEKGRNTVWYCAADVAKLLDYHDAYNLISSLPRSAWRHYPILTSGGWQNMYVINDLGVFIAIETRRDHDHEEIKDWAYKKFMESDLIMID